MSKAGIQALFGAGLLVLSVVLWFWGDYWYDETFRDAVREQSRWIFPNLPGTTAQRAAISSAVIGLFILIYGLVRL